LPAQAKELIAFFSPAGSLLGSIQKQITLAKPSDIDRSPFLGASRKLNSLSAQKSIEFPVLGVRVGCAGHRIESFWSRCVRAQLEQLTASEQVKA